ncbi:MAG: replicative DNA helicase [Chlamydiae bacterium]|nr:MAG: replicative DNA helicase [Chlamydiota bacterium]
MPSYESTLSQSTNITNRIPPHSKEAEQCVLGAMMLDETVLAASIDALDTRSFYFPGHRHIFSAAENLYSKQSPVDVITITDELTSAELLEQAGGPVYLSELVDTVPTTANYEHYIKIVRDKWLMRELISASNRIVSKCYESNQDISELLGSAQIELFDVDKLREHGEFKKLGAMMGEAAAHLKKLIDNKSGLTGVDTGFTKLNEMTTGLHGGELIIIAARPSVGKTALALNLAENAAVNGNKAVAIFSLEMTALQLTMRILSSHVRINAQKLRRGGLTQQDLSLLLNASASLKKADIYIDPSASLTPLEVSARCRRLKAENPNLGLIIIDYIQLMQGSGKSTENRQQEISYISRSLKALALELELPVVALSQLNRESEKGNEKGARPKLSQLRESGAIEQDADLVLLLFRKYMTSHDPKDENTAELIVAKQRNGPIGNILLKFENNYARFEDPPDGFAEIYYGDND